MIVPSPVLNTNLAISVKCVGREKTPLLVIDNCLADPSVFVKYAIGTDQQPLAPSFKPDSEGFYPGLRCALPSSVSAALLEQLRPHLIEGFALNRSTFFQPLAASLSIAGIKKEHLRPIQSLPHFDDTREDQLAVVLYLFDGDLGGTGFYRHISTGFERITRNRVHQYAPQLKMEAMAHKEILFRYMGHENALFENTEYIRPLFNRAVIYPSNCLHSGVLSNELDYSMTAANGRLTANMLFILNEAS